MAPTVLPSSSQEEVEAQGRPAAPRGIDINSRRPCLSQVGANPHHVLFASSACRLDDEDTGKQHCRCHHNFPPSLLHPSSAPLYGPVAVLRKRLRLVDSRQRHFFLLPGHRMPACVPLSQHRQSSKLRGLHVELPRDPSLKNAHTFLLVTHHRSRISHMCLSRPFSISMRHTS